MPALANVVLADSAAVNHTFIPVDIQAGSSSLSEQLAIGQNALTQYVLPRGKRIVGKQRVKIPVSRSVNGEMQVVDYMYVNIDYSAPEISTPLERKDLATLGKSAASRADFISAFELRANYF